jgi:hypothetical protein
MLEAIRGIWSMLGRSFLQSRNVVEAVTTLRVHDIAQHVILATIPNTVSQARFWKMDPQALRDIFHPFLGPSRIAHLSVLILRNGCFLLKRQRET